MFKVNIRFIGHSMEDRRALQDHVQQRTQAVVLIPPQGEDGAADQGEDLSKETSRVMTNKVQEISQEGCTFNASSVDGLMPGSNITVRLVADGLALELGCRVVHVSRAR